MTVNVPRATNVMLREEFEGYATGPIAGQAGKVAGESGSWAQPSVGGTFTIGSAPTLTGGIFVNNGTLRPLAANVLNGASNALSLQPAATFNLNNTNQSVNGLTLEASVSTAASVVTGTVPR